MTVVSDAATKFIALFPITVPHNEIFITRNSFSSSSEVKNGRSYTFTPAYTFMECT